MGGDIFWLASPAEVKELKEDPSRVKRYKMKSRRGLDLGPDGYVIDTVLCHLMDMTGDEPLALAVKGGQDIGGDETVMSFLPAARARAVAEALAAVDRDGFEEAMCKIAGTCHDLTGTYFPLFQDLLEFYRDAAREKKAVVKTIY